MHVRTLVELICDIRVMEEAVIEMKYDAQKAPLGKLTKEQVKAGYLALVQVSNIVNCASGKKNNKGPDQCHNCRMSIHPPQAMWHRKTVWVP